MTDEDRLRIVVSHISGWPEVRRGAERYVHELAAALAWLGHDVQLVTSAPQKGHGTELGVPVTMVGRGTLDALLRATTRQHLTFAAGATARVLRQRIDVWHANSLYDGAAAGLAGTVRPRLRTVFTAHGPAVPLDLADRPRRQAWRLARRADRVIAVSEPAGAQLRADWALDAAVVPPGVDSSVFTPGGGRSDKPTVLYVGSLTSRRKNLALLLEAVAVAARSEPEVELTLVGQGDPSALIAAAPDGVAARVRDRGALRGDDLVEAYRNAWVTALPSEREVFGMVVVESLSCGTPAVVLDDGWGPAAIVEDGVGVRTGQTAEELGAGLVAGLRLAREKDTAGRCRAVGERYDWRQHIAPRLVELYRADD